MSKENLYALLKLFGERYIFCDDEQAQADAKPDNREDVVAAYTAILNAAGQKEGEH